MSRRLQGNVEALRRENSSLKRQLLLLQEAVEKERLERARFQLERDKLAEMREIESRRLEEARAETALVRQELLERQLEHLEEVGALKAKTRYLIGEREARLAECAKQRQEMLAEAAVGTFAEETGAVEDLRCNLARRLGESERAGLELLKQRDTENSAVIARMVNECGTEVRQLQAKYASHFTEERAQFALILRNKLHEITEIKNRQIGETARQKTQLIVEQRVFFKTRLAECLREIEALRLKASAAEAESKEARKMLGALEDRMGVQTGQLAELTKERDRMLSSVRLFESEKKLFERRRVELAELKRTHAALDLRHEALLGLHERTKAELRQLEERVAALVVKFNLSQATSQRLTSLKMAELERELKALSVAKQR